MVFDNFIIMGLNDSDKSGIQPLFSKKSSRKILVKKESPPNPTLTQREKEILKLIAWGNSNREIGKKLLISPRTVDSHRAHVIKKLRVNNIAELIIYAIKNGLD